MAAHNTNPVDYGWTPQGGNAQSRVEFYQHESTGTKMDYYPTTGAWKAGRGS